MIRYILRNRLLPGSLRRLLRMSRNRMFTLKLFLKTKIFLKFSNSQSKIHNNKLQAYPSNAALNN
jgi:hypothetical protein